MSTHRANKIILMFVSVLGANAVLLALGPVSVAAERPSEAQILRALKPGAKTRGLAPAQPRPEDQRFIEGLRGKTRSLTAGERQKVADIVKEKPTIDLEVYFAFNSAEITRRAVGDLTNLGRALGNPDLKGSTFIISGHTDAKGGEDYNQRLSERRAEAVKQFLTQRFGIDGASLVTAGYGEEQLKNPANPNAGENRRVQIGNLAAEEQAGRR
jgi:outer membrane protein OmpA-like peptidoglycan-associated protein